MAKWAKQKELARSRSKLLRSKGNVSNQRRKRRSDKRTITIKYFLNILKGTDNVRGY
jgi:hypothetical protein